MSIELSAELAQALELEAERRGMSSTALAVKLIESQLPTPTKIDERQPAPEKTVAPQTLYDRLKDHIGAVNSRQPDQPPSRLSEDTGRKFTELLLEKRRQGRL